MTLAPGDRTLAPPGSGSRRAARSADGQASIELVGLLPLLLAVALGLAQLLAAGYSHQLAGHAAQAGAMAVLQGGDPQERALEAIPGWSERRADIEVDGRRVAVRLRPPAIVPGLADRLATTVHADAGPQP